MADMAVPGVDREDTIRLGTAGRAIRLGAAALVLALTAVGTVWGQDSAFPVGPFRMYSTRNSPDAPVSSTRVDGVTTTGERIPIRDESTGLRRAEIEGQTARLIADESLLGLVAESYARRNPDLPPLRRVEIVVRRYELRDGLQTGSYTDTLLASWTDE